jgi:hypothetical protein
MMADTSRGNYADKHCAHCGIKGRCYLKHWGPLMRGKVVYLDECAVELRSVDGDGIEPTFDRETGERFEVVAHAD